jgi:nucleoid-associated protein YgaU
MGLLTFMKEAGEKLFGRKAAAPSAAQAGGGADTDKGEAIANYVRAQNLKVDGLIINFDQATSTVTVSGVAADQATREKIVLSCGNVEGVEKVENNLTVERLEPEAQFYTVTKGDTLSKIAKQCYGDPNEYPTIFEANRPMLSHPDKVYPGQMLRIPESVKPYG